MSDPTWQEVVVPSLDDAEGRVRLDTWLASVLDGVSRSKVQEMIEAGQVRHNRVKSINGKASVKEGDVIAYIPLERAKSTLEPVAMNLEILYEDDDVLVVNKPAGLAVHPGAGETGATLVHGLLAHAKTLGQSSRNEEDDADEISARPGIVHRLDKDTTGALVVAKTDLAHAHLSKQFHDKTNFRQYVALFNGPIPDGEWVRESWLHRDPRDRTRFTSIDMAEYSRQRDKEGRDLPGYRYARTLFKREAAFGPLTLASVRLYTGRTHQIRVHARDMEAPVWGDQSYGRGPVWGSKCPFPPELETALIAIKRQLLHAWVLGFEHPVTKKWLQFEAPLPEDFSQIIIALRAWSAK